MKWIVVLFLVFGSLGCSKSRSVGSEPNNEEDATYLEGDAALYNEDAKRDATLIDIDADRSDVSKPVEENDKDGASSFDTDSDSNTFVNIENYLPKTVESDGCQRTLLSIDSHGIPFSVLEFSVSRDGSAVAICVDKSSVRNGILLTDSPDDQGVIYTLDIKTLDFYGVGTRFESKPGLSSSGRYIVFTSDYSESFDSKDTNGETDVYILDQKEEDFELISVSSSGEVGNRGSGEPLVSGDGRFIVFTSLATNLVPNDVNEKKDIFVRDRELEITEIINVFDSDTQSDEHALPPIGISDDGRFVLFTQMSPREIIQENSAGQVLSQRKKHAYVRDRQNKTTTLVAMLPEGNDEIASEGLSLSPSGDRVLFSVGRDDAHLYGDDNAVGGLFITQFGSGVFESVLSYEQIFNASGVVRGMSEDARYVLLVSKDLNFIRHVADLPPVDVVTDANEIGYILDRNTFEIDVITASEDGEMAYANLDSMVDEVQLTINGNGKKILFTTRLPITADESGSRNSSYVGNDHNLLYLRDCL